ncbi:hypothetical protein CEUSTIGMA_g11.t1 [Chlamydomonas eustigma]|uniref:GPI-anchor transamidase n=1 Tax=Chlamydomonas eustigma TaxID=1157962 RepID=A0A250WP06_9CHLO|nr:hypothetical protein CEUSTIGMA_g11.t1 [Chlamydomonas eustigma]|eukprot:GAX72555.1 hypothetical protein CEUSTIGMA_g11.t1 [Chlamydomonas eustigma]
MSLYLIAIAFLTLLSNARTVHSADPMRSKHTSNWAVLVDASKFWLNYRHVSNILAFYHIIKRLGIPDSNIIVMAGDDMACNPRNPYPSSIYHNESHALNLYDSTVEVDYRGSEVTVENFFRLLIGRHEPSTARSKRLLSNEGSNIFIFLTGHGGDGFIKVQDVQELVDQDLADALQQMHEKKRYNEILLMIETCEAATMIEKIAAPGIIATGSSVRGQSSFSYRNDDLLGQPVVDRFSRVTLDFTERLKPGSTATLSQLFDTYTFEALDSEFSYRTINVTRPLSSMRLTDFLGASVAQALPVSQAYPFRGRIAKSSGTHHEAPISSGRSGDDDSIALGSSARHRHEEACGAGGGHGGCPAENPQQRQQDLAGGEGATAAAAGIHSPLNKEPVQDSIRLEICHELLDDHHQRDSSAVLRPLSWDDHCRAHLLPHSTYHHHLHPDADQFKLSQSVVHTSRETCSDEQDIRRHNKTNPDHHASETEALVVEGSSKFWTLATLVCCACTLLVMAKFTG